MRVLLYSLTLLIHLPKARTQRMGKYLGIQNCTFHCSSGTRASRFPKDAPGHHRGALAGQLGHRARGQASTAGVKWLINDLWQGILSSHTFLSLQNVWCQSKHKHRLYWVFQSLTKQMQTAGVHFQLLTLSRSQQLPIVSSLFTSLKTGFHYYYVNVLLKSDTHSN